MIPLQVIGVLTAAADVVGAVALLLGSLLCLGAAIGLVRFPDVLTRMHAATKPQTLGLLLVLLGVGLSLRDWRVSGIVVLIGLLQLFTAPVAAHLVARTAYRTRQLRDDLIEPDELGSDLRAAGFQLGSDRGESEHRERPDPPAETED